MFGNKPLIVIDVPVIPVLDPLFSGECHVIVYDPVIRCGNLSVIDEVVDDILVGEFVFREAELNM